MRALPARRVALGALCAALLAGLTGPAATAAEHDRATPSATTLLAQVRTVDADEHGLTPVVDLLEAVLGTDDGRLSSGEVRKLGDAAKDALAKAADEDPVAATEATTTTEPSPSATTADDTEPTVSGDDLTSEELTTLRETLDALIDLLRPATDATTDADTEADTDATTEADTEADESAAADPGTTQEPSLVDELLARVHDLVAELLGTEPQTSTLPAPAAPAQAPLLPGVTLPALTPLTSMLVPSAASS
ncbi:hypothetical protein ACFXAE_30290 [Streptomyces sp. NPDC059454]|jgi:hypothetical protein|uniref:hypothetical protein n=1 Tax=Streptomyces sp. NPDC059454 TaxID=3346836 RepID=UPI0036BD7CF5